ncbi:lytic transglycosylase domain-containing protein [Streptomyces aureus]|uniref:lytic transglycosylase domain-containing protein n=1 Tax=Streptomyces aureus TaxID=193461 RepID=UPI00056AE54F|nr:lytic transglycosylase domain-containing protein [Streptomyces aureus]
MAAQFGRRLRKGAATTAVAMAAVAALSASQAPGVTVDDHGRQMTAIHAGRNANGTDDGIASGNSRYYTDLPPLQSPNPAPSASAGSGTPAATGAAEAGIPATVLAAYKQAEASLHESKPTCNMPWQLLAAIGKVESGQARGGRVDANGTTFSPILGPVLNGNGFASIKDTDHGAFDGDSTYDRAVGPMQFIPSTWAWAGRDGNGDGKKDPNNIFDAALAAGHYLCRFDHDMSVQTQMNAAILSYNNSTAYLTTVLSWLEYYRKGTHEVPDGTGALPSHGSDEPATTNPTPTPPQPSGPSSPRPPVTPKPTPPVTPTPPATPTPPPTQPPTSTPTPMPTPTETVDHLTNAGAGKLTATAGDTFAQKLAVRTDDKAGKPVAKVRVRFTVIGDTDATFAGGESVATQVTNAGGVATAPALVAGEKTGDFTVRVTVVGRVMAGLDYTASVTERQADTLARTGDTPQTCVPGGEFADQIEVKATYKGAAAGKVAATATLVKSADDAGESDKGPYFKDADGKPVRTLATLTTDADGLLKLPKLYADDTTGTFLLRITTAGGATLTIELTVAAAS